MTTRPYEISLWSHNDNFISILASSESPKLDEGYESHWFNGINGEQKLSFTVPIKVFDKETNEWIDNERWYNSLKQEQSLANEKKVKLIFDKFKTNAQGNYIHEIHEFIIERMEEERNESELVCRVDCIGVAFKELGKIGSEILLNFETLSQEEKEKETTLRPTINYWLDRVFPIIDSRLPTWTYEVRNVVGDKIVNKIYETNLIENWAVVDDALTPQYATIQPEKERYVDIKDSNKYNITQDIAEQFEVFVDYQFLYESEDEPFKVTKKIVLFYNELITPTEYSITYGNNELGLKRISDSANVTTKMFVTPVESEYADDGFVSLAKAKNNKNKDNFILNFDYFLDSGLMPVEYVPIINQFELDIRNLNEEIDNIANTVLELGAEINITEADVGSLSKKIQALEDNLRDIDEKILAIGSSDDIDEPVVWDKDILGSVKYDGVALYLTLRRKGVLQNTLSVKADGVEIAQNKITFVLDNYGYITKLIFSPELGLQERDLVYCTYQYDLLSFYRNERLTYQTMQDASIEKKEIKDSSLELLKAQQETAEGSLKTRREQKQRIVDIFNIKMSAFLREGTWEDSSYKPSFSIKNYNNISFIYDPVPRLSENLSYRKVGTDKEYYHYILPGSIDVEQIEQLEVAESFTENNVDIIRNLRYGAQYTPEFIFRKEVHETTYQTLSQLTAAAPSIDFAYFVLAEGKVYSKETTLSSWAVLNPVLALVLSADIKVNTAGHVFKIGSHTLTLNNNLFAGQPFTIARRRYFFTDNGKTNGAQIGGLQTTSISLHKQDLPLEEYEHYNVYQNGTRKNITLKNNNQTLPTSAQFNISYKIDVSSDALYRDALGVSKTSAYPEVEYEVDFIYLNNIMSPNPQDDFNYGKILNLGNIVRITDHDLQIRGLKGLVTETNMNLDRGEETKFTVRSYKTKFDDLFARIIASSEQMKNNGYLYDRVLNAFGPNMTLTDAILARSMSSGNFSFELGGASGVKIGQFGILVETPMPIKNGVKGQTLIAGGNVSLSDSIHPQTGERIWSTAITPEGINASAITSGRLDVGTVNIYSGDQLRFAWKSDGLIAYKSKSSGETDLHNYVKFYEEGLFLTKLTDTNQVVNRVEVSWDGLILRNDANQQVFYADPDTGNLRLTGAIYANAGSIDGDLTVGGSLSTPQFYSGALGLGWRITGDGSAEFNNVYVRGTISASVFEYDKISSVGGSLYIAPTLITMQTAPVSIQGDKYRFTIPHGFSTTLTQINWSAGREWKLGDVVSLQGYISRFRYDNDQGKILPDPYELKDVRMKLIQFVYDLGIEKGATQAIFETIETIDAIDNREETMQWKNESGEQYVYSNPMPEPEDQKDRLEEDAKLIYWGTVDGGNTYRKGIYMTAAHADSPYIDVYDSNASDLLPKVRLGKLDGLRDSANFPGMDPTQMPDVHGYGLYSENVFLKGTIYATAGRIGSLEIREVEDSVNATSVQIESLNGLVYNQSNGASFSTTLVARVYRGLREVDNYDKYQFQWQEKLVSGGSWTNITGATTRTYSYTASDQKMVRCWVTRNT